MQKPQDIYIHCDVLEKIPEPNRKNYLFELNLLKQRLPQNARVLQVGSMDGTRLMRLHDIRPDLHLTGLEIELTLVELAQSNVVAKNLPIAFIHGDITQPPLLPRFDYVICLNNTLGYIPDETAAIDGMKKLGKQVIISVYGEQFDDQLAKAYFASIHLEMDHVDHNTIFLKDFTQVKRYSRSEVESWGGQITETPIGYFCELFT